MAKIKIPEVDCLYCRVKGACITDSDKIETVEGIITRPIICGKCNRGWKDFYSSEKEDNVLLEVIRNKGEKGHSPADT